MSAGRIDRTSSSISRESSKPVALSLPAGSLTIRKHGLEFWSAEPLVRWTEVTLAIESTAEQGRVECRGVVVDCEGDRSAGYHVSLLFLGLTPARQRRLESMALSHLG
jgi:hypothetical protein